MVFKTFHNLTTTYLILTFSPPTNSLSIQDIAYSSQKTSCSLTTDFVHLLMSFTSLRMSSFFQKPTYHLSFRAHVNLIS